MKKQITVSLFLLICTILADGSTVSAIATPTIALSLTQPTNIAAEPPALSKVVLTLQDLPPGFIDISDRMETLKKQLSNNFNVESLFAYQKGNNDKPLQLLLGVTTQLPTQSDRDSFDASIRQGDFLEVFQSLKKDDSEVVNPTRILLADNIGDVSIGWTATGKISDRPTTSDILLFRRGNLGVMLITFYVEGDSPIIAIAEAARKLDSRIVELIQPPQNQLQ